MKQIPSSATPSADQPLPGGRGNRVARRGSRKRPWSRFAPLSALFFAAALPHPAPAANGTWTNTAAGTNNLIITGTAGAGYVRNTNGLLNVVSATGFNPQFTNAPTTYPLEPL